MESFDPKGGCSIPLEPLAKEVFDNVSQYGDQALKTYTEKFDKVKLECFSVDAKEIELAKNRVQEKLKLAIQKAREHLSFSQGSNN